MVIVRITIRDESLLHEDRDTCTAASCDNVTFLSYTVAKNLACLPGDLCWTEWQVNVFVVQMLRIF